MAFPYQSVKISHQVREADKLKTEMRKKSLLVLIYEHLLGQGYVATATALDQETNGSVRSFDVCDNIDLDMVLREYESFHYIKFQKYPKVIRRRSTAGENRNTVNGQQRRGPSSGPRTLPKISSSCSLQSGNRTQRASAGSHARILSHARTTPDRLTCPVSQENNPSEGLNVLSIRSGSLSVAADNKKGLVTETNSVREGDGDSDHMERLLKPLSGFSGLRGEISELAAIISRDIYLDSPNVRWDDIIGLEDAKRLVKEAIVYPIKYPQLFTGIVSPWKGLLLYGPPGTGKTMLAKAVATECRTTFFNISASSIVSKWRGDSEKLVRVLFELARYHAPSTIFLDELESVMSHRVNVTGEHEGSRRMKTELLVQMDGLKSSDDLVFVLTASNLPWELDHAMLRRLEKRILVGLPSPAARRAMISQWLPPHSSRGGLELRTELDYEALAQEMEGYSGSDVKLVCKEAAMRPVRKIFDALESHQQDTLNTAAVRLDSVTTADFLEVIAHTKPSARKLMTKYAAWEREYESVG